MVLRSFFESDSLPVLERVLAFTEARHRVLAANVANVETPGYRRQDLAVGRFQGELERAIERRRAAPGRFDMAETSAASGPRSSNLGMVRHDQNDLDLDREMALLGRNALLHNTAAALARAKYNGLRLAISGTLGNA